MALIRPFIGLRPLPDYTKAVIAPPYDILNRAEAAQRAKGKPWSFLHISRAEIDLPSDIDAKDERVYAQAKQNLSAMLAKKVLKQDQQPLYYAYELTMGEHQQIGLVAAASVTAYDQNRIRKHEFTRPDKEDDRVKQIDFLDAQTGPVLLTYKQNQQVKQILAEVSQQAAVVDEYADDGIRHRIWLIADTEVQQQLSQQFEAMPALYIADGHHRSAAAARVAAKRQSHNPQHNGEEAYNYFLSVMFADEDMKILDYNRVISDLNGHSVADFLAKLAEHFDIEVHDQAFKPTKMGEFGLYLDKQWYALTLHAEKQRVDDPVARLDISLLAAYVIEPLLGISDPRRDKRIDFVGGIRGLEALEKRVDEGDMVLAFAIYPTSMADLMAVADAEQVMPPKSTWFEPKLADGLISHLL